jgi:ribosomal protein L18
MAQTRDLDCASIVADATCMRRSFLMRVEQRWSTLKKTANVDAAKEVGSLIARKCQEKGIAQVIFDRNGFLYHGRIRAVAEAAREAGLQF